MADETPKKPLPFSSELPALTPAPVTDEIRRALMALIANAANQGADVQNFNLANLSYLDDAGKTVDLGDWKITVARTS